MASTNNTNLNKPNCEKEYGCKCRHILRLYVLACTEGTAAFNPATGPRPFFIEKEYGKQDKLLQSRDLYYLTICDCCDRHTKNRPTWDELVAVCPDLASAGEVPSIEILAKNMTNTGKETIEQTASVGFGNNTIGQGGIININVTNSCN